MSPRRPNPSPRRRWLVVLAAAGLVVFTAGLVRLMLLRFEAGDVYPPYSSLRTDPLGTKALYQALDELPGVRASRNHVPLRRLPEDGAGKALLLLGRAEGEPRPEEQAFMFSDPEVDQRLRAFAESGGRVVIAGPVEMLVAFGANQVPDTEDKRPDGNAVREANVPAEGRLPWHTHAYVAATDPDWRTIYAFNGQPVVMERSVGHGSVVALSEAYVLSNEALRRDRAPKLLAWLVGPADEVIFDEAHLGVAEQTNIAALARRHGLDGVFAALLLLAALFLWKSATSFLPKDAALRARLSGASVSGRGLGAGLHNLLRKSVPPSKLLDTCVQQWAGGTAGVVSGHAGQGSAAHNGRHAALQQMRAIAQREAARPRRARDVAGAYREISRLLARRPAAKPALTERPQRTVAAAPPSVAPAGGD